MNINESAPVYTASESGSSPDSGAARNWELRSVEPGLVRVGGSALTPSREVVGVVWEGQSRPLDTFLAVAGDQGWDIVAAGNVGERHHRLYLKRLRPRA